MYKRQLYKQSEKLRFLIDSLVKLSRLENGIISLAPQQVALQPLLESVVEQYAAKASETGLSLQLQDTDTFAVFDFKWTAEALANIVDNAIKYTEHGTITISAVSYEIDVYKRQIIILINTLTMVITLEISCGILGLIIWRSVSISLV